ncbi:MAG TPA: hypothetical protein VGF48_25315 [Thermoanaerobaculia bacterium]
MIRNLSITLAVVFALTAGADETCPLHEQHMKERAAAAPQQKQQHAHGAHAEAVDARGAEAMGFSQQKTKHTFRLHADGGAIEVRAIDGSDRESIASVRTHLAEIARLFPNGDFAKPEYIHGKIPDGVPVMLELLGEIDWKYEEVERGARVRIRTRNARAREAIHAFLRFQIDDHRTGDNGKVE